MILLFAFTTIIASYPYAESGMIYLGLGSARRWAVLRGAVMVILLWGAVQAVAVVFNIAALAIGIMAVTNLVAILALSSIVVTLARDFMAHRKAATVPEFQIRAHPSMAKGVEADIRA
ncbi:MAG: alanine:cation symporter family protein [Rhodobacteraceae bacterium]|nr:alanine:cation symporter family protein [Paracoccaceae bacterium]